MRTPLQTILPHPQPTIARTHALRHTTYSTSHLCQLLLDGCDLVLCEVGAQQTHATVDVKTNTTWRHNSLDKQQQDRGLGWGGRGGG